MEFMPMVDTDERNIFQKASDATGTIVTPANAIDAVAFVIALDGIKQHDTWSGIVKSGAGYAADAIDGKVARATKTQSDLGEAIDAGGDKIKLVYALAQIWKTKRAPRSLLTAVAVQNTANAAITVYDRVVNEKPQVHPTRPGKHAYFMQEMGIGLNVIGSKVAETAPKTGKAIKTAGTILGWAGVIQGFTQSTPDYWRQSRSGKHFKKPNPEQDFISPRSLPGH